MFSGWVSVEIHLVLFHPSIGGDRVHFLLKLKNSKKKNKTAGVGYL